MSKRTKYWYQHFRIDVHVALMGLAAGLALCSGAGYEVPAWAPLLLTAFTNAATAYAKVVLVDQGEP